MKMNRVISVLTFCFLISNSLSGQEKSSLRAHYQGYNVVFPGVELAYQYPVANLSLNKEKESKLMIHLAPVFDFYHQAGNHTGIGLMGELTTQMIFGNKMFVDIYGGFGVQEAILAGQVYELNESGGFDEKSLVGNTYAQWKAGVGFGKLLTTKSEKEIAAVFRIGVRKNTAPGRTIVPNIALGVNFIIDK